jgi:hypothetical protein
MQSCDFHPLAARELAEAVEYYEQVEAGKGIELARQVRCTIDQIREFPKSAPISVG